MILKSPDAKNAVIAELERIFLAADKEQQAAIARELHSVRAGVKSESESAYLINFHLRHSQNTIVIHDLRLVLDDGRVAHIDHLLIHRSYRFYILESKNFSLGIKINDRGEFSRWSDAKKTFEYIASPIEQNERHAAVLRQALASLGLHEPHIQSFVLIAPHAPIRRPQRFDTELIVSADQFMMALNENLENASFLGLLTDTATPAPVSISDIALKLIGLHRPATVNYAEKTWLNEVPRRPKDAPQENPVKTIP